MTRSPPRTLAGPGPLVTAREALSAMVELSLPAECAVCAAPGAGLLCSQCHASLVGALYPGGPRRRVPHPCPAGLPPVSVIGAYAGALGRLLAAYKDGGRRDAAPLLGRLLYEAVSHAIVSEDELRARTLARHRVWVVPVPSSRAARRRRGDVPMTRMARAAGVGLDRVGVVVAPLLQPRRRVADQAGLTARERALNLEWSMQVPDRRVPVVDGAGCVVVDDVLTTGATLVEATRALRRAGAARVVAATVCATERHGPGRPTAPRR